MSAPANATAGANFGVTVTVRDQFNNTATGYTGTVHFTATSAGTLPLDSTLTGGVGNFNASLTAAGPRTITARDVTTASIAGTQQHDHRRRRGGDAIHGQHSRPVHCRGGVHRHRHGPR